MGKKHSNKADQFRIIMPEGNGNLISNLKQILKNRLLIDEGRLFVENEDSSILSSIDGE